MLIYRTNLCESTLQSGFCSDPLFVSSVALTEKNPSVLQIEYGRQNNPDYVRNLAPYYTRESRPTAQRSSFTAVRPFDLFSI